VAFDSALKITVQIPKDVQATPGGQALQSQLQALSSSPLASTPQGLAYLNQLAANPNVQWDKVALANEKWSYDQAGLTPAGAALLSIAVAAYMPGASGMFGATTATGTTLGGVALSTTTAAGVTTATFAGAALNAGFTALASQAAVAMVNNKGDIGKTLEQLGKEESIKGLLTTMVTAGALNALGNSTLFNGQSGAGASGINGVTTSQAANQFTSNLLKNVTNNVAGAAIDSAINGKPLDEKALASALSNALITAGMAQGANSIGASDLNSFTNKLAHAALGCAGGAAMGGSCKSGAVGAVVGELAAEYINPNADPALKEQTLAFAKTMAAVAGVIVGGGGKNAADVNVAATAGANAAENNYLAHSEAMARAALKDKQAKGSLSPAEQQQLTNLEVLDIARDLALKDACQAQGDACNAARRDLNAAIGSYATTAAGYNARLSAAGNQSVTAELNQTVALSNDPALAQQTLWDSFKEFAGPQAAGYAAGAVIGKYISEAQAVYAAIKAEAGVVPSALASGANAGTKVAGAVDDVAVTGRPTPRQSEIDVGVDLPPGARPQVSFKNGQEVPYGTSGSVRPDYCLGNVCSVEVKNYNITTNSNGLVSNVSQQAIDRAANLPPGMTQTVVIDIRGQTVTTQQLDAIRLQIVQRSNGAVSPNNIRFKDK
jgi:filamentous hemagglutinin